MTFSVASPAAQFGSSTSLNTISFSPSATIAVGSLIAFDWVANVAALTVSSVADNSSQTGVANGYSIGTPLSGTTLSFGTVYCLVTRSILTANAITLTLSAAATRRGGSLRVWTLANGMPVLDRTASITADTSSPVTLGATGALAASDELAVAMRGWLGGAVASGYSHTTPAGFTAATSGLSAGTTTRVEANLSFKDNLGASTTFTDDATYTSITRAHGQVLTFQDVVAPAAPATGVLDSFNSGASQLLSARTGWSATGLMNAGDLSPTTDAAPTYLDSSNTPATEHSGMWASSFAADQEVWFTYGSVIDDVFLIARGAGLSSSGTTIYDLYSRWQGELRLERDTVLLAHVQLAAPLAGDSFCLQVIGSTLYAWKRLSGGSWVLQLAVNDATYTGAGYIGVAFLGGSTGRVDEFGGGAISSGTVWNLTITSTGAGTSAFGIKAARALTFASTGTGTSSFAIKAKRALGFASTGASSSVFGINTKRALSFASTGSGTSAASIIRWRTLTLSSTGAGTSTFGVKATRALAFASTGAGTSAFPVKAKRALAFASTGSGTSSATVIRWRTLSVTSTGTGTSAFAVKAKRALAFASTGAATSALALTAKRALTFSSTGSGTSALGIKALRALVFASTGAGVSTFGIKAKRALTFTSTGTGTSAFAPTAKRALTFNSTGTGASTMTINAIVAGSTLRQLVWDEHGAFYLPGDNVLPGDVGYPDAYTGGIGTDVFTLSGKRSLSITSTGAATSAFSVKAKRALAFSSTGAGTSTVTLRAKRALTFASTGSGTSAAAINRWRTLAITSTGTGTSSLAVTAKRALTLTSTGAGTSSLALTAKRALAFSSTGAGTSALSIKAKRALVLASTGVGTSSFATTRKRALTLSSTGTGTTTFAVSKAGQLLFTSAGAGTDAFNLAAKRALAFSSTGVGTSSLSATRKRGVALTSTGVGTSTFALNARHAITLTSAGIGTSAFSVHVKHALFWNSTGVGTSTFAIGIAAPFVKGYGSASAGPAHNATATAGSRRGGNASSGPVYSAVSEDS